MTPAEFIARNHDVVALLRARGFYARLASDDPTSIGFSRLVLPRRAAPPRNSYHDLLDRRFAGKDAPAIADAIQIEEEQRVKAYFAKEER